MSGTVTDTTRIAELEADNRRLRQLFDKRDAPGELRHRLRNTVALLRTIIRKSAATERDFDSYIGQLEDRLDALTRAQGAADSRGSIDLHTLLADELHFYGASEGERALLSGPEVDLHPRAGQLLAMAVHELAVNAVEHGALGMSEGRVEVTWSVSAAKPDGLLTLVWKELHVAGVSEPPRQGFGMELLTRTLPYEIKAATTFSYEADGLRCTIVFPLLESVGYVVQG